MVTSGNRVKLGDFGLARDMFMGDYYRMKKAGRLWKN